MNAQTTFNVVNPVRLCALVVLIISAPKVLTETNCECLVISKHSGDEWFEHCGDTTTDITTSTTYTVTTPADVASQKPTTQKPAIVPTSSGPLSSSVKVPVTKPNTGTTKGSVPVPKPSTKPASQTTIKITTKKPTPVPTTKKSIPVTTKVSTIKPPAPVSETTKILDPNVQVTIASATKTSEKPGNEGQFEPLSEPSDTGSTVGSVVGAIVGVAAVVVALILFWKLGVLKKCKEFPCKRSKVGTYDVENGEVTKNGTKPLDAQKGTKPPDAQNGTKLAEKTLKTL